MIVLAEPWEQLPESASASDIRQSVECAGRMGCRIFTIPPDFAECEDAVGALSMIPDQPVPKAAIWIGYIPDADRYQGIYEAALSKNIVLPNPPELHRLAMEMDRNLPLLDGITPTSVVVSQGDDFVSKAAPLGFPLFIKGTVQSRKSRGIRACVASSVAELSTIVQTLFDLPIRSRGRVVIREFVRLRHERLAPGNFPVGREYRVFVYRGQVLSLGYYWGGQDSLARLLPGEESAVRQLALEAAARTRVPYLAVDIGQIESGDWIVVEIGDGQFAGLSQVSPLKLWNKLSEFDNP